MDQWEKDGKQEGGKQRKNDEKEVQVIRLKDESKVEGGGGGEKRMTKAPFTQKRCTRKQILQCVFAYRLHKAKLSEEFN